MEDKNLKRPNITVEAMQSETQQTVRKNESPFNEKNYLNVRLKKGEKKREIYIRLLPIDANSSTPFCKIHTHNVKVPKEVSESGFKNYICLSKTNPAFANYDGGGTEIGKCPFCELNRKAYDMAQQETDPMKKRDLVKLSTSNHYKETYIVRCIERGAEEDGPKFYKFNAHKDGSDVYHKIISLYETRYQESIREGEEPENILDLYTGRDLKLTVTASEDDENRTNVDVMDSGRSKPLSKDPEQIIKWVNDPKKWSDVFTLKPYDYLSVVLQGKVPYLDKASRKWIDKDNRATVGETENTIVPNVSAETLNHAEEYANELPF